MGSNDWITHIRDNHINNSGKALCGEYISTFEFVFQNIDHWFNNARNEGRLVGCKECLNEIKKYLEEDK